MRFTNAEYLSYLARRAEITEQIRESLQPSRERDLHNQIMEECKRRGWIAIHSRMDRPTGQTLGTPDLVILADLARVFLIECKSAKGKLSMAQMSFKAVADKLHHPVYVVRSCREFLEVISDSSLSYDQQTRAT